ncbi:MAG: NUDIX hydrolase [Bacteroidetes bacterium]|nr:NUDIX hydrolase [Bacteroidota bacterium]
MSLQIWTKRSEETLHRNPWWLYKRDRVTLPSGAEGEYHYVQTPGSVMVIPVDAQGCFVLVRQYRYLNRRESLEFPAGGIKAGQDADAAARAELREEAGLEASSLEKIGQFNPFNGVTDELCTVYVATELRQGDASPDDTEEFEVQRLRGEELVTATVSGALWDGMTLAAWAMYQALEPGLGRQR